MKRTTSITALALLLLCTWVSWDLPLNAQSTASAEKAKGAWLGVRLNSIHRSGDEKNTAEKGAEVSGVIDDSPADKAGITKGDIIVDVDGGAVNDADDLVRLLKDKSPGAKAQVTVLRDGKKQSLAVTLGEAKKEARVISKSIRIPRAPMPPAAPFAWSPRTPVYGFSLNTLSRQLGEYFGAPEGKGVLIESVKEESDAAKAGFKAGDVILRAGKKTITAVDDFRTVLAAYDAGESIPVEILRKGGKMTLNLTAKEAPEPHGMLGAPGMGHIFRFRGDGDDDEEMEDIDIDIDIDDIQDHAEGIRLMLNGKQLELQGMQEELQKHLQEMQERIDVSTEDKQIRIRTRQI
jgi:predicted metalloprotease with PDZ domain